MNRRSFLASLGVMSGGLLLPYEPQRAYAFASPWFAGQDRFERALLESARTGRPAVGDFDMYRDIQALDGIVLTDSKVRVHGQPTLWMPKGGRVSIKHNTFEYVDPAGFRRGVLSG